MVGLRTETLPITLTFYEAVADLRDERTGAALGAGDSFDLTWTTNEALVLSFLGSPEDRVDRSTRVATTRPSPRSSPYTPTISPAASDWRSGGRAWTRAGPRSTRPGTGTS